MRAPKVEPAAVGEMGPPCGQAVLRDPMRNRGSAFGAAERRALGLDGLLPCHVSTIEEQGRRAYGNLSLIHI